MYLKKLIFLFLIIQGAFALKISAESNSYITAEFPKYPVIYQLEKMTLSFIDKPDFKTLKIRLYSPELNHFSSDPIIESVSEDSGSISLLNVFFIHPGKWHLLISNDEFQDKIVFDIVPQNRDKGIKTHKIISGTTYVGQEYYNDKATGQVCYVIADNVEVNNKGKFCYDIKWRYASLRSDVVKNDLTVSSRITNYHRAEYPKLKTCVKNIDGTTDGDDIYGDNTDILVNDIFNGIFKEKGTEYHLFLSLNTNKELKRARIHGLRWNKEWDVDCINLKEVK